MEPKDKVKALKEQIAKRDDIEKEIQELTILLNNEGISQGFEDFKTIM
jgi:hypothetical protein